MKVMASRLDTNDLETELFADRYDGRLGALVDDQPEDVRAGVVAYDVEVILSSGDVVEVDFGGEDALAKGIGMRVIRSRNRDTDDIWLASEAELRELRWAPAEVSVAMTTLIYGNCVAMISSKRENYGLIIESEGYALHQGMLFDALWALCSPAEGPGQ